MTATEDPPFLIGELTAQSGEYRPVVLDRVVLSEKDDQVVMAGIDTRIEVRDRTVGRCGIEFYREMVESSRRLDAGWKPTFARSADQLTEFHTTVSRRLAAVLHRPLASQNETYELEFRFWPSGAPSEAKRVALGSDPAF